MPRVGPGSRALDVATGTGDLAVALRARGATWSGSTSPSAMLELAREQGARTCASRRATRSRCPSRDGAVRRRDGRASGPATSPTSTRGLAEMARVTRPGGRVVVLEITTPQKPPLSWFFRLWFDRVVPRLGRLAGDPDAYTYLPARVRRFPGPAGAGGALVAAGLDATSAGCSRPAASSRLARAARRRVTAAQAQLGAVLAAGGPRLDAAARAHRGAARRGGRGARPGAGRHAAATLAGGRQAAAPDAGVPGGRGDGDDRLRGGRRRPWSCCTWPRSCTTTCSTARRCGAAGPPSSRRAGGWPPPPPATCSSRGRSPSWP